MRKLIKIKEDKMLKRSVSPVRCLLSNGKNPPNILGGKKLTKIKEDKMKRIISILFVVLLSTSLSFAQTHGVVSGRWTPANSPYIIDGEILILDVDTLRIEPGVEVQFSGHYKFNVYGRLFAEGTTTDSILFTVTDTTGFSTGDHTGWGGIRFRHIGENGVDSSKVDYCKLEYGKATGSNPDYRGGAVYCENSSDISIKHCLIENNSALSSGGGIYLRNSDITIENVILRSNSASGYGGGIYMYNSSPNLAYVEITNNTSDFEGGGIGCYNNSNLNLGNVTISQNISGGSGDGVACLYNSSITILNSIIWNNGYDEIYISAGSVTATYSDIRNGTGQSYFDSTTCIDADPLFENPDIGEFHLTWVNFPDTTLKSPCIDVGNPDSLYYDPDGTRNDLGVYYFPQSGIQGTVTLNGGSGNVEDVEVSAVSATDTITVHPDVTGDYIIVASPGTYDVTAYLSQYDDSTVTGVIVLTGETTTGIDFTLEVILPGTIEGTVALEGLGTVTEVEVTADGYTTNPFWDSDLEKYCYIIEIPAGNYDVTASLPGYVDSTIVNVQVISGEATVGQNFVLQLIKYEGYIEGTVTLLDTDGQVITDTLLIKAVEVTADEETAHPDTNGVYQITIDHGVYDVTASLEHYTSITIDSVEVVADDTTKNVNMTLINWDVIQGTEYNMIVYATATLDGKFVCADSSNQLAAFGPDSTKCRGVAVWEEGNHPNWDNYWDLEGYWYITVVDTIENGQAITFKLYETKTDSVYQCYETLIFGDCVAKSIDLTAPSPEMDQVFGLIEDWNWISFNVQPDDYSIDSVFAPLTVTPDIYQVKNGPQSATYFVAGVWQGGLNHITNGEGYLADMINAVDPFTVSGTKINPVTHPINLVPNWNWVGYYPYVSLTLSEALASISATVVKTQDKSAVYYGGSWVGDLTQLEPGITYKICVPDSSVLIYPLIENDKYTPLFKKGGDYNSAGWEIIQGTQYNMIAMADIMINDVVIDNNNEYIVGVFDEEGNCRSIGYWVSELWYFTIVGNKDDEDLDFRIYDSKNDIVYESNEKITFTSDSIIGNPEKPIIVTFKGSPADISLTFDLNQNYPNPFGSTTGISYTLPKSGHVHLTVYNVKGQLVETLVNNYQEADNYKINWDASKLSSGIYFYKLSCRENSIVKRCLIMK